MKSKSSQGIVPLILVFLVSFFAITFFVFRDRITSLFGNLPKTDLTQYTTSDQIPTAHNTFGFEMLKALYVNPDNKDKNVFISPSSIALALSMAYNGADTTTKDQMAQVLHVSGMDINQFNEFSAGLLEKLQNIEPKVELAIANSIWARQDIKFNQSFLDINKKFFNAEVQNLDFTDPASAGTINTWVDKNTKGKISQIVDPPLNTYVMFLINAVYFKGAWTHTFDSKATTPHEFTTSAGQKKMHPLMQQKRSDYQYLENNNFQAIRLPYGENKRLGMYLFLPKQNISNFINSIDISSWNQWLSQFDNMEGTILLPTFKNEYETSLNSYLKSLGMDLAFTDSADFSKMSNTGSKDFKITQVKHKSFVEVNEEGTEAAAVTSIGIGLTSLPKEKPKTFYMEINKPFLLAIQDSETEEILFLGVINNPEE